MSMFTFLVLFLLAWVFVSVAALVVMEASGWFDHPLSRPHHRFRRFEFPGHRRRTT